MSRQTVLIVDDELNLLRALRDAVRVRDWDVDVLTAGNAEEALELMALKNVDVLVTDIRMPGVDGLELIERVRERYPRCRCLVMTAHVDADSKASATRLGAVSFIHKPFELDAFLEEVQTKLKPRGFRGTSLVGFSLPDILQLVAMNGHGLTFQVISGDQSGEMVVEGGKLLSASTEVLAGEEAAFDILAWEAGEITSARSVEVAPEDRLDLSLTELLMMSASRADEGSRERVSTQAGTSVDALVRVIEEVEREVAGFLGSIVCRADDGQELGGVKAKGSFPREWLSANLPRVHRMLGGDSTSAKRVVHRLVLDLDDLTVVVRAVGEGEYLWISAVRRGGGADHLDIVMERLRKPLRECLKRFDDDDGDDDAFMATALI